MVFTEKSLAEDYLLRGGPKTSSYLIRNYKVKTYSRPTFVIPHLALREQALSFPRLKPENLEHNKYIFERVNELAARKGCTPGQLALAWVLQQGDDVCPIPGTTKTENFNQNVAALSVKLSPAEMAELESYASLDVVKGERHLYMATTWINSDTPPLSSWKAE